MLRTPLQPADPAVLRQLRPVGPVLWLGAGGPPGWEGGLRARLGAAVQRPELVQVPVARAQDAANPWAFRDREEPLRWPGGAARLAELPGPRPVAAVLERTLFALPPRHRRALLEQLAEVLPPEAPLLVLEGNGRGLGGLLRGLAGRPEPTAEEIRRALELSGFGLRGAWALGKASRYLPAERVSRWIVVLAARIATIHP